MPGKLKLHASLGWVGDNRDDEIDLSDDWETMTEDERNTWCEEMLAEHVVQYLDSSYEVVEDGT